MQAETIPAPDPATHFASQSTADDPGGGFDDDDGGVDDDVLHSVSDACTALCACHLTSASVNPAVLLYTRSCTPSPIICDLRYGPSFSPRASEFRYLRYYVCKKLTCVTVTRRPNKKRVIRACSCRCTRWTPFPTCAMDDRMPDRNAKASVAAPTVSLASAFPLYTLKP